MFVGGSWFISQRLKAVAPVVTLLAGTGLDGDLAAALREKGFRVIEPRGERLPKTGVILESRRSGDTLRVRMLRATNRALLREVEFDARAPGVAQDVAQAVRQVMSQK